MHTDIVGKSLNKIFITELQALVSFTVVTCRDIYGELIHGSSTEHHSVQKWEDKFPQLDIDWSKIWASVHNPVATESMKTLVWEQIHLNDYCTYSYNKWHNKQDPCPLCLNIPTKFHLTLECEATNQLWKELEPHLRRISEPYVTDTEKVFDLRLCSLSHFIPRLCFV